MSKINDLIQSSNSLFQQNLLDEIEFSHAPDLLVSLKTTALSKLNTILKENQQYNDTISKTDLNKVLNKISKLDDKTYINKTTECDICNIPSIEETINKYIPSLKTQDIQFEELSKIEENYNKSKISSDLKNISTFINDTAIAGAIVYLMTNLIIDFINSTDKPSISRSSILQNSIQNKFNLFKEATAQSLKDQKNNFLNSFKALDGIILLIVGSYVLWEFNKEKIQSAAKDNLNKICCLSPDPDTTEEIKQTTSNLLGLKSGTIDSSSLINGECPIDQNSEIPVVSIPFDDKSKDLPSCEITQEVPISANISDVNNELAVKAIIENLSVYKSSLNVTIGEKIDQNNIIFKINNKKILNWYSPVSGVITNISSDNKTIYVDNIEEVDNIAVSLSNQLTDKFTELDNIKKFITDYITPASYTSLLYQSSLVDISTLTSKGLVVDPRSVNNIYSNLVDTNKTLANSIVIMINNVANSDAIKTATIDENKSGDNLKKIQEEITNIQTYYINQLQNNVTNSKDICSKIISKEEDYKIFDHYLINLYLPLNNINDFNNINTDILSQNNNIVQSDIEQRFKTIINQITTDRFKLDGNYNYVLLNRLKNKISILSGKSADEDVTFMISSYIETHNIYSIKDYLFTISANYNNSDKESIIKECLTIFIYYINPKKTTDTNKKSNIIDKQKELKDLKERTSREFILINNFFINIFKRLTEIPVEIEELNYKLNNIVTFNSYSIKEIDNEQYRYYTIVDEKEDKTCPIVNTNIASSKKSDDINYWLKYCGLATLISLPNLSTVIIGSNTIQLPVIYIPIKSFSTVWGVFVIGLGICGISISPFTLFANCSNNYNLPLPDSANPITIIKKEITNLKNDLISQVKEFKNVAVNKNMSSLSKKCIEYDNQINQLLTEKGLLKAQKPNKSLYTNVNIYQRDLLIWNEKLAKYDIKVKSLKVEKNIEANKYKILSDSKVGTAKISDAKVNDPTINSLEKTETNIIEKTSIIDKNIDNIDNTIKPLAESPVPIAMKPQMMNFGFTIKNTKPVIKIGDMDNGGNNINKPVLNTFLKSKKLNKNNFITNINGELSKININDNLKELKGLMIINKECLPKYEDLSLSNLSWSTNFISKEWGPTGAKTYGTPGQNPLPI